MNIHASYNVFDNEELLEDSIKSIREYVSEVSVVYQKISNFGDKCNPDLEDIIFSLKNKKLIDNIVLYETDNSVIAAQNELNKNNIGYLIAKIKKNDYHMCMNCDEFYFKEDFTKIIDLLKEYPVDLVTGYMYTYYKTTNYRFKEIENYVVGILNKVHEDERRYILNGPNPILIDPTRRMEYSSCFCFPKTKPIMHHLSHVRKNFQKKLLNSTSKNFFENDIENMVNFYNNWKPGDKAYLFNKYVELEYTDKFVNEITF